MIKKFSSLVSKIKNSDFLRSVFSIGGGKIFAQVISFITIPILTRIYAPSVFGDQQVIVSAATIILSVVNLGLASSIMSTDDNVEAKEMFITCTLVMAIIAFLLTLVMCFGNLTHKILNVEYPNDFELLFFLAYVILTNICTNLSILANRLSYNRMLFTTPIINSVCNLLVAVPLGYLQLGYSGLMSAGIISSVISIVYMCLTIKPLNVSFSYITFISNIKKKIDYVKFQSVASLLGALAIQLPTQVISRLYNSNMLGNYSMCVNMVNYPITLLGAPLSTAYFRKASEIVREGVSINQKISDFSYKIVKNIILIGTPCTSLFILFGKPLVMLVLGQKWLIASNIMMSLIYPYMLGFCALCITYCRVSLGKQKINLFVTIVKLALSIGIFAYASIGSIGFSNAIDLYGVILSICNAIDILVSFIIMKRNTWKVSAFLILSALVCYTILFLQRPV